MGNITNYTGLVLAIQEALEDDSTETAAYIPTAIKIAQFRLSRETDQENVESNTTVSGASGSRFITKPSGYLIGKTLSYSQSNGNTYILRKQTRSFLERYWIYGAATTGQPKYYADYSNTQFLLAPTPDAAFGFSLSYVSRPAGLSTGNETNVFTQWIPDALFHASMVEMARYARNTELLQYHEAGYVNAMQGVNNEARRARREEGLAPNNTNVNVNTLKQNN